MRAYATTQDGVLAQQQQQQQQQQHAFEPALSYGVHTASRAGAWRATTTSSSAAATAAAADASVSARDDVVWLTPIQPPPRMSGVTSVAVHTQPYYTPLPATAATPTMTSLGVSNTTTTAAAVAAATASLISAQQQHERQRMQLMLQQHHAASVAAAAAAATTTATSALQHNPLLHTAQLPTKLTHTAAVQGRRVGAPMTLTHHAAAAGQPCNNNNSSSSNAPTMTMPAPVSFVYTPAPLSSYPYATTTLQPASLPTTVAAAPPAQAAAAAATTLSAQQQQQQQQGMPLRPLQPLYVSPTYTPAHVMTTAVAANADVSNVNAFSNGGNNNNNDNVQQLPPSLLLHRSSSGSAAQTMPVAAAKMMNTSNMTTLPQRSSPRLPSLTTTTTTTATTGTHELAARQWAVSRSDSNSSALQRLSSGHYHHSSRSSNSLLSSGGRGSADNNNKSSGSNGGSGRGSLPRDKVSGHALTYAQQQQQRRTYSRHSSHGSTSYNNYHQHSIGSGSRSGSVRKDSGGGGSGSSGLRYTPSARTSAAAVTAAAVAHAVLSDVYSECDHTGDEDDVDGLSLQHAQLPYNAAVVRRPVTEADCAGARTAAQQQERHLHYPNVQLHSRYVNAGETEERRRRLEQRRKQVMYGKDTDGYRNYRSVVPHVADREYHNTMHPMTPRPENDCSKRTFDKHLNTWRRQLHQWDSCNLDNLAPAYTPLGVATLRELGLADDSDSDDGGGGGGGGGEDVHTGSAPVMTSVATTTVAGAKQQEQQEQQQQQASTAMLQSIAHHAALTTAVGNATTTGAARGAGAVQDGSDAEASASRSASFFFSATARATPLYAMRVFSPTLCTTPTSRLIGLEVDATFFDLSPTRAATQPLFSLLDKSSSNNNVIAAATAAAAARQETTTTMTSSNSRAAEVGGGEAVYCALGSNTLPHHCTQADHHRHRSRSRRGDEAAHDAWQLPSLRTATVATVPATTTRGASTHGGHVHHLQRRDRWRHCDKTTSSNSNNSSTRSSSRASSKSRRHSSIDDSSACSSTVTMQPHCNAFDYDDCLQGEQGGGAVTHDDLSV